MSLLETILLGIYGSSAMIDIIYMLIPAPMVYKRRLKKDGYIFTDTKLKNSVDFDIAFFLVSFIPILNSFLSFLSIGFCIKDYNEDYVEIKNELLNDGIIEKSDKLLLLEEEVFLKEHRFNEAKKDFYAGKLGNFDDLDDVKKIEIIQEERKKVYSDDNNDDLDNAYNKLSREEKLEFLTNLRKGILKDYTPNEELMDTKTMTKRLKGKE